MREKFFCVKCWGSLIKKYKPTLPVPYATILSSFSHHLLHNYFPRCKNPIYALPESQATVRCRNNSVCNPNKGINAFYVSENFQISKLVSTRGQDEMEDDALFGCGSFAVQTWNASKRRPIPPTFAQRASVLGFLIYVSAWERIRCYASLITGWSLSSTRPIRNHSNLSCFKLQV